MMARKPKWTTITRDEIKKIEKNKVEVKCGFCKGTGKDPFRFYPNFLTARYV